MQQQPRTLTCLLNAAGTTEGLSAEQSESSFGFFFLLLDEVMNNPSVLFITFFYPQFLSLF